MTKLQDYLNNIPDKNKIKVIVARRDYFIDDKDSSEVVWNFEGGDIDLSEFPNLEYIDLSGLGLNTPLTTLDLNNCANVETLIVSHNDLDSLDFLNELPKPNKLKELDITSNDVDTDLKIFSKFTNLEKLRIGNSWGDINQQEVIDNNKLKYTWKFNKIKGNLKPLKPLTKLIFLDFTNTDIDDGIEHLPNSLVQASREKKATETFASGAIHCSEVISKELQPFNYDIQSWKDANP